MQTAKDGLAYDPIRLFESKEAAIQSAQDRGMVFTLVASTHEATNVECYALKSGTKYLRCSGRLVEGTSNMTPYTPHRQLMKERKEEREAKANGQQT